MAKEKVKKESKKKLGGGAAPETEAIVITEEFLAAHPELAAQGFTVGQTYHAPKGSGTVAPKKETKDEGRSELDESTMKSDATGQWYVKSVGEGLFRLYNEVGQAVSPIVSDAFSINKAASRANALNAAKLK